jgi:hypothetical protein
MRRTVASLLALAVAVTPAAAAAPAADAATKRSACQRLKGRDLAAARYVKLVARPNADDDTDLVGCMLPRGRVRKIASGADLYTTVYTYSVRQIAGRHVLVGATYSSQYAYSTSLTVHDLRSGRAYTIASECTDITGYACGAQTVASAAFVTLGGRAVALVHDGRTASVTAFEPSGASRVLDSASRGPDSAPGAAIPPESLRLTGNLATWTNAGVARSADLRTPG